MDQNEASRLRAENDDQRRTIDQLTARIAELEGRIASAAGQGRPPAPLLDKPAPPAARPAAPPNRVPMPDYEIDLILSRLCSRAAQDPGILALLRSTPELVVTVDKRTIDASDTTLFGKLAVLIADGFFDTGRTGNAAFEELKRRGASTAKPNVYRECDKLAGYGFLTKESDGYRVVPSMKVRINERASAA